MNRAQVKKALRQRVRHALWPLVFDLRLHGYRWWPLYHPIWNELDEREKDAHG
jgi:hypothetical protein